MYLFTCSIKCYTDIFTTFKCYKWLCKYALCTRQWLFYHHFYFLCSSSLHSCRSMRSLGKLTSQQWSRLVLLEVQSFWRHLVSSCAADWTDGPAGSQEWKDERQEGWKVVSVPSFFSLLAGHQHATGSWNLLMPVRLHHCQHCCAFQPGVTAALLLAANDGSSTRWQCSSGIFGCTEAAPVLTQQDLNTNLGSYKQ